MSRVCESLVALFFSPSWHSRSMDSHQDCSICGTKFHNFEQSAFIGSLPFSFVRLVPTRALGTSLASRYRAFRGLSQPQRNSLRMRSPKLFREAQPSGQPRVSECCRSLESTKVPLGPHSRRRQSFRTAFCSASQWLPFSFRSWALPSQTE